MDKKLLPKMLHLLCACLLLWACAAPARQIVPDAETLYSNAVIQEKAGKALEACQSYTLLWKTYPGSELAPKSLYQAASVIAPSDPDRAIELYRAFLASYPRSPLIPQARQGLLAEEVGRGRFTEAYNLYLDMFEKPDSKLVGYGVRITRGLAAEGKHEQAMVLISTIFPHGDTSSRQVLLPLWKASLEGIDRVDVLEGCEEKAQDKLLRDPLLARKAKLVSDALSEGSAPTSGSGEDDLLSWPGTGSEQSRGTVGVLLPLSGKYETIGQKALKGIMLASGVFGADPSSPLSYAVRDYGDNEQAIPGIIEALDATDRVVAVIGPVGETAGGIACREAQKRGIPFLPFTRAETAASGTSFCFSNFVSVDVQVEALLKAASARGITRFGILYPTDNFGKTFTATFARKAKAYGVQVIRQVEYSPDLGDFKGSVQKLFRGAKGGSASFQGLLVPDGAQNAGMIASYLPYLNIKGVRLFGPALWDSPELARIGGRGAEDALFVTGFYGNSASHRVQAFNDRFHSTFGYRPSLWEATAYDSATILQSLAGETSPTRASLQAGLGSLQSFPAVTGTTTFGRNGSVSKAIYLLTVKNGTIVEVVP
ncbi:MAG TPA: ABC transporter substrate-binding protein [Deltaproteobacteria bacterium]|nr:ABC transporter substrate-binding protein [Deltaproteobacteria bacterium]HOI08521.1 ABC transporter substrate-binding protein [Deltaproteobacteria bacterium]